MVGREYQHLEDLIFCEDYGARHALYILKNMPNYTLTIKWDGSPTIYFGRDQTGKFMLVGKNGWGREVIQSADELEQWTLSRGKDERWRPAFAKTLSDLWNTLEPVTHFKGFVFADVLWHGGTPAHNSTNYYFRPNQVLYTIPAKSELGVNVSKSSVGLAIHTLYNNFGDKQGVPVYTRLIDSETVFDLPQTLVSEGITMPTGDIDKLERHISRVESKINQLFVPRQGLSDIRDIVYKFVNHSVKHKTFSTISVKQFLNWINESNLTFSKQGRLRDMVLAYTESFTALFETVILVNNIKNDIIEMLDRAPANISAFTGQFTGGEGFIIQEEKVKLVQRSRWIPYKSQIADLELFL